MKSHLFEKILLQEKSMPEVVHTIIDGIVSRIRTSNSDETFLKNTMEGLRTGFYNAACTTFASTSNSVDPDISQNALLTNLKQRKDVVEKYLVRVADRVAKLATDSWHEAAKYEGNSEVGGFNDTKELYTRLKSVLDDPRNETKLLNAALEGTNDGLSHFENEKSSYVKSGRSLASSGRFYSKADDEAIMKDFAKKIAYGAALA